MVDVPSMERGSTLLSSMLGKQENPAFSHLPTPVPLLRAVTW